MALTHLGYLNIFGIEVEITMTMVLVMVIFAYGLGHMIGKEVEHVKHLSEAKRRLREKK